MAKSGPQILTANRLKDGEVLYRKGAGWVQALAQADVYPDPASAAAALAAAQSELPRNEFVAPYLFDVRLEDGQIRPVKEREIIRAAGPTVRRDLGKQASPAREAHGGGGARAGESQQRAEGA